MSNPGLFYAEKLPSSVLLAQAVGLTCSSLFTGQALCMSIAGIPAVMLAPAPLAARQWAKLYAIGSKVGPALAGASTLATGYLAYLENTSSLQFKLYTAATILVPAVVPYTLAFMKATNDKLHQKADALASTELSDKTAEAGVKQEETVHALLDKWATLNLIRSIIGGAGFLSALWAVLDR